MRWVIAIYFIGKKGYWPLLFPTEDRAREFAETVRARRRPGVILIGVEPVDTRN